MYRAVDGKESSWRGRLRPWEVAERVGGGGGVVVRDEADREAGDAVQSRRGRASSDCEVMTGRKAVLSSGLAWVVRVCARNN